jgi:hypothetical protein
MQGLQREVVFLGWPIAPSYMSPKAGGGGELRGCQPMSTAVHRSLNKLWRSNCIFNLWVYFIWVTQQWQKTFHLVKNGEKIPILISNSAYIIECFIEDQAFLAVVWFGSSPTPSTSISKLDRRHTGRLRKGDNLRGWGRRQIIRRRESLVLYKSFNTLRSCEIHIINFGHNCVQDSQKPKLVIIK